MPSSNSTPEIWKAVVGYEGFYEVSSLGRVRRIAPWKRGPSNFRKVLKPVKNRVTGYDYLRLHANGNGKTITVHKIVTEAFLGPKKQGFEVNHKDGRKQHNFLANLEYLTRHENIRHGWKLGLHVRHTNYLRGEMSPFAKLQQKDVQTIRLRLRNGDIGRKIALDYHITPANVSRIKLMKTWKHT